MITDSSRDKSIHYSVFKREPVRGISIFTTEEFLQRYDLFSESIIADFYIIVVAASGEAHYTIDGESGTLKQKSALFIPPERVVSINLKECSGFLIAFFEDFYTEEYNITRLLSVFNVYPAKYNERAAAVSFPAGTFEDIITLVKMMMKNSRSTPLKAAPETFTALLHTLFTIAGNTLNDEMNGMPPANARQLERLLSLIDMHYSNQQSPLFYSEKLNMRPIRLNRLVSQYLGCSVKHLIRKRLMLEARKLLTHTDMQITEIGYHLNFADISYFSKTFSDFHRLTPTMFRKIHKKHQ